MKVREAVDLIRNDGIGSLAATWCDLGCGTGTFTLALAELLAPGSKIYAVDKNRASLRKIPNSHGEVTIERMANDFASPIFSLPEVDGALMANALHFVRDQAGLLKRICSAAAGFLVVEYDRSAPSVWEPFPVSYATLHPLLLAAGYRRVVKLRTRQSVFGGELYAAWATR
jgi:trans-aconitate methyltransferase